MSNLTQFFGIQSSGGTVASTTTGKTVEALTTGDGVRLTNNGDFVKSSRSAMAKGVHTQAYNDDQSGTVGNLLNLNAESTNGRYVPYENAGAGGFVTSDNTYIQIFYKDINQSSTLYYGWRSFNLDLDNNFMEFKDWVVGSTQSNMYGGINCEYREIYSDANYIHIAASVQWRQSNSYYYHRLVILRLTKSNKALTQVSQSQTNQGQYSPYNNGQNNGGGTVGTLANGVLVYSYQEGNAVNDRTGRMALKTILYDYNAPSATAAVASVYGSYADYNDAVSDCIMHDHDTRTFITFEAPVALNDSKLVRKHVIAANGGITTTTVNAAFTLSNWTDASTNRYCRIYKVSTGVFAALFPETTTTFSIQKFTWDGNTTLTQTGDKIVLTLPSGLTIESSGTALYNYYHMSKMVNGTDPSKVYISHSASQASLNASQNLYGIDLVAGTLTFATSTYGLVAPSRHTAGNHIAMGDVKTVGMAGTNYNTFDYKKFDTAYFNHSVQTKDVVGVVLADATANQADASVAMYSGVTSTSTLPATNYVTKNGQGYVLDVPNSILPSERLNKAESTLARIGPRSDYPAYSAFVLNQFLGTNWWTNQNYTGTDTNYNMRNQTGPISTAGSVIMDVSGAGMFKSDMYFGHQYNASGSMTAQVKLMIDGVEVWNVGRVVTFHGYNYRNTIPNLTGVVYKQGFQLLLAANSSVNQAWNAAVQTVEMT